MEPLTLREEELQEAREAAADIIQNKKPDEALSIFTEGLVPIRSVREMELLKQREAQLLGRLREKRRINRSLPAVADDTDEINDAVFQSSHKPRTVRSAPF